MPMRARGAGCGASLVARETLIAPVSGVIARADLAVGQVIESRDILFEVVDPERMLVEATTADATLATRVAGASLQGLANVKALRMTHIQNEMLLALHDGGHIALQFLKAHPWMGILRRHGLVT